MKPIAILMKFFGRKPGQTLAQFGAEVKKLSSNEKEELVELAAKEMKVTPDWN